MKTSYRFKDAKIGCVPKEWAMVTIDRKMGKGKIRTRNGLKDK